MKELHSSAFIAAKDFLALFPQKKCMLKLFSFQFFQ